MIVRRRGHSLAEALVAISLLGILLGTVTMTLGVLYRADRNLREAAEQQRALDQFSARFRADAHQASSAGVTKPAEAGGQAAELILKTAGEQTISYTWRSGAVERVVRRGNSILHRETYAVAAAGARWQLRDDRRPALASVAFSLAAAGGSGQPPADEVHFEAAVRLLHPPP